MALLDFGQLSQSFDLLAQPVPADGRAEPGGVLEHVACGVRHGVDVGGDSGCGGRAVCVAARASLNCRWARGGLHGGRR
ncbi:hypothetical protein ABZ016_39320 [Streptomyces sp. NPDC006372]|uniref:hypothetical protein n=1 Tax=Streptomyces sp. NPDC006372 TaxID=3155599 RepID=UPI0033B4EC5B